MVLKNNRILVKEQVAIRLISNFNNNPNTIKEELTLWYQTNLNQWIIKSKDNFLKSNEKYHYI